MVSLEQEAEATYLRDHWDSQSKAVGFMLTAHGVTLVTCLTVLKDYAAIAHIKGLGIVIVLASIGLIIGAFAYGALTGCRALQIKNARQRPALDAAPFLRIYNVLCIACFVVFVAEVVLVALRLGKL